MSTRYFIACISLSVASSFAFAQDAAPQPNTAAAPESATTMPMPMHDHGAERGMPMAKSHMAAASAPKKAASTTAIKGHDHAKFHKQM